MLININTVQAQVYPSSLDLSYQREFDPSNLTIELGSPLIVTVSFVNSESTAFRGVYSSEQIHSDFSVQTIGVKINGIDVLNYQTSTGSVGDVYNNHIPYYWLLETPPKYPENNPVQSGDILTIIYQLVGTQPGSYNFNKDGILGIDKGETDDSFFALDHESMIIIVIDNSINEPPVANDDLANTIKNTPVNINILANDYDPDGILIPSSVIITGEPTHGEAKQNDATGVVTYTPEDGYYGTDDFDYTVEDNNGLTSNVAGVKLNIDSVNIPPLALNDIDSTYEHTPKMIDILSNDSDPDGILIPSSVIITTEPPHGEAKQNVTTGVVTYTPEDGYYGTDDFNYTVEDNNGLTSNVGYVKINIKEGDDPLPVELSLFTLKLEKGAVELIWKTESEINNIGFEIWRMDSIAGEYMAISSYLNNQDLRGLGNSSTGKEYNYFDSKINMWYTYYYKLINVNLDGSKESHGPIRIHIDKSIQTPESFIVSQNYPNPFNPSTKINFDIPDKENGIANLSIIIYDLLGRKVKTLYSGKIAPGNYEIEWNGFNNLNQLVPSGIYVYQLTYNQQCLESRKMTLLR